MERIMASGRRDGRPRSREWLPPHVGTGIAKRVDAPQEVGVLLAIDPSIYSRKLLNSVEFGPRVEERSQPSGLRRDRRDIRALVPVAERAGVNQVAGLGLPTMLFADHVVDVAAEERVVSWIRQYSQRRSARSA